MEEFSPTTSVSPEKLSTEGFSPTSATPSSSSYAFEDGIALIMVQSILGRGAVGKCYKGTMGPISVVIKSTNTGQEQALEREAFIYEQHLSRLVDASSRSIGPKYYGYFEQAHQKALVLEYAGKSLESFDQLAPEAK